MRICRWARWISVFTVTLACCGYARAADNPADNPELKQIYEADQKDRAGAPETLDWKIIAPRDASRRKRVRELLEKGRVSTGKDYERAAMVFQHGDSADDVLMAHILAVTAVGQGEADARWLAAAALDRFLQRTGRPQVFGTQYSYKTEAGKQAWTMEPYDRALVPPGARKANCVPDEADQAEMLKAFSAGKQPKPPKNPPCPEPRR